MHIRDLVEDSFTTATEKGWHEKSRSVGDFFMLMVSEISEALEEFRAGHLVDEVYFGEDGKPEGVPIELADLAIRLADFCGAHGIDLEAAIETKAAYNKTRSHRHGGKTL